MILLAVTVIGGDRPGIIADVTGRLAELDGNLEDSSMTLLRGQFAMTLVVSLPPGTTTATARAAEALAGLAEDGSLSVDVREIASEPAAAPAGRAYLLSVHGGDRPGIVSAATRVLAEAGGNITDLTTRLAGDLYLLVAEVDLPDTVDVAAVSQQLHAVSDRLGVEASLRPADADLM